MFLRARSKFLKFLIDKFRQRNCKMINIIHSNTCKITIFAPSSVSYNVRGPCNSSKQEPRSRTTGSLPHGMRFQMYRISLYADSFTPRSALFTDGSAGSLYMSPSSFHVRSRRSKTCIRTLFLTPSSVSLNAVINYLIDDLFRVSINGFECVSGLGEDFKVFLDMLAFTENCTASTAVIALKGYTATIPCTHCGFTNCKALGRSVFAYTTSVSSCNTSYRSR